MFLKSAFKRKQGATQQQSSDPCDRTRADRGIERTQGLESDCLKHLGRELKRVRESVRVCGCVDMDVCGCGGNLRKLGRDTCSSTHCHTPSSPSSSIALFIPDLDATMMKAGRCGRLRLSWPNQILICVDGRLSLQPERPGDVRCSGGWESLLVLSLCRYFQESNVHQSTVPQKLQGKG